MDKVSGHQYLAACSTIFSMLAGIPFLNFDFNYDYY